VAPKLPIEAPRSAVVVATMRHAKRLAPTMRKADREEIYASRGMSPKKVLMESIRAALFGVVQAISEDKGGMFGIPWVLTGAAVENDRREFWRWSKEGLRIFLDEYGVLANYVDARHEQAIRWLKHLGAEIDAEPKPHGKLGLPFYRFIFRRKS
jgi:hypothetical protein